MGAKMDLKKPTGRRRRPMKILPHPAPRQIPSNSRQISVKFWRPVGPPRQIPSNSGGSPGPVKFRQIPSNSVKFQTPLGPLLSPPAEITPYKE